MQDRYAADVGDFIKLGLLRCLSAGSADGGAGLTIGVNWYLARNEDHNEDGKHTANLQPVNALHARLRACDPDLMSASLAW